MTNIESIEVMKGTLKENEPTRMYSANQMDYMFKAFEVMKKIAIGFMEDSSELANGELVELFLIEKFEKEMNKNETKI